VVAPAVVRLTAKTTEAISNADSLFDLAL
jgi:hypothetical protein